MKKLTCYDGTEIEYRLPNVIELFELQDKAGWGDKEISGFGKIARILSNAEPFVKVKGKKWKDVIEDRKMADDLSNLALLLVTDTIEDDEKND